MDDKQGQERLVWIVEARSKDEPAWFTLFATRDDSAAHDRLREYTDAPKAGVEYRARRYFIRDYDTTVAGDEQIAALEKELAETKALLRKSEAARAAAFGRGLDTGLDGRLERFS